MSDRDPPPAAPDPAGDAADPGLTGRGTPRQRRPRARRAIVPTPEMLADAPEFEAVPSRTNRHDGWTYERQRAFIAGLAETGCVDRAARRIGMTAVGAYRLRKLPGAEGFAAAWAEAQALGVNKLSDIAFDRAINGVPVPVFYKGEQVGERRWYNDRLLMWTLRHHDPEKYGGRPGVVGSTSLVPPHIRKRLYAEWEREMHEKARETLAEKIAAARARFGDHDELVEGQVVMPEERRLEVPGFGDHPPPAPRGMGSRAQGAGSEGRCDPPRAARQKDRGAAGGAGESDRDRYEPTTARGE
ncbi:MAG: hypothetical protein JOY99_01395 [Sphingomonadaceae bacterium]|nr:hypothetical protein [Sphingomonadaceae bacterium]